MVKKLHEMKLSEFLKKPDDKDGYENYYGDIGFNMALEQCKQWAIAVVKNCDRDYDNCCGFPCKYDKEGKEWEKRTSDGDPYFERGICDVCNFLIDRFEITKEELK